MAAHGAAERQGLSNPMLGFILFLSSEVMFFGGLFAAYFIARADSVSWPPEELLTPTQIAEGRRICDIVCVQNQYNLAHRDDDRLIDDLARDGIAYVPFFPLGGFNPLQSSTLSAVAQRLGATPMQVALAWLLQRSPNILLIPGTSSVAHLRQNLAVADLALSEDVLKELDTIGGAVSA